MQKTKVGTITVSDNISITAVVAEHPAIEQGIPLIGPRFQLISAWYSDTGCPLSDEARVSLTVFRGKELEKIFTSEL